VVARAVSFQTPLREGVALDDFESNPTGWKFVGGEEYPGAKGSLALDPNHAHGGKTSYRLEADFSRGGAYVGSWKKLQALDLPEIEKFRLWVQARNLDRLGIRILDATGQCRQQSVELPPDVADGWHEVILKVHDSVGGEHWGGINDSAWHGPPRGLGFNIGKDVVVRGSSRATLWIDDLRAGAYVRKDR
jgi:hypothetical protein